MIKRLRNKFILINMAIVSVMLVVIFSLVIFFMGMNMEMETWQRMDQAIEDSFHKGKHQGKRGESWRPNLMIYINQEGKLYFDNNGLFEALEETTAGEYAKLILSKEEPDGILQAEQMRYRVKERPFGTTIVLLDISHEIVTMKNLVKTCIFISILSFFGFLVISILLARWAVKPVETAWNQQRQFVADASHELKTPLTVIMTNAELLQSPLYDREEQGKFVSSILAMSHQMRGLVESLLELARVDNGSVQMDFSALDFSELVSDCLLPFEPVYFEKELLLESSIDEGLKVKGSMAHLRQVMDILLDNAAKYSSAGSTVVVTAKRQGSHCLLSVSNPGDAISKADLKNIFKRFYRIDQARSMNHSYGLGLAIAQNIIKEHSGKIWAESEKGINTFFIQLPVITT